MIVLTRVSGSSTTAPRLTATPALVVRATGTMRRSIGERLRMVIGDQFAIEIGEALAQLPLVQLDAAQIDRGCRNRRMPEQHLHHLEGIDTALRRHRGATLKVDQHRHRKGVPTMSSST